MTLRKRRILLLICVIIFVLAALIVNFYVAGYRLNSKFKITKTGGIYIYSPLNYTDIYLNNKFKKQTGALQKGFFIQNLKPEKYTILAAKEGYWPWQNEIKVEEEMVIEIKAMLTLQNPAGKVILKGPFLNLYSSPFQKILVLLEKEKGGALKKIIFYLPAQNTFLSPVSQEKNKSLGLFKDISNIRWEDESFIFSGGKETIKVNFNVDEQTYKTEKINPVKNEISNGVKEPPNEERKFANFKSSRLENFHSDFARLSPNKKEMIWRDQNNAIWFDVSSETASLPYFLLNEKNIEFPIKIFQSKFPLTHIDFLPNRRDIIVVAIDNGVYALELDGRGERMIHPVYKGKKPIFAAFPGEKNIYILDDENLMEIEL